MEFFRGAVRIVDDVVLFQSGDARRVKPDAHCERPEDEHDHWREDGTRQCLSTGSQVHSEVIMPRLSYGGTSGYGPIRDIRQPGASILALRDGEPWETKDTNRRALDHDHIA